MIQVGERVQWESGGKLKVGVVLAFIPAGEEWTLWRGLDGVKPPYHPAIPDWTRWSQMKTGSNVSGYDRYLVEVGRGRTRVPWYYAPRADELEYQMRKLEAEVARREKEAGL